MTEPDVAITDFLLAAECALLAFLTRTRYADLRSANQTMRAGGPRTQGSAGLWFASLYASIAVASVLGGIEHGFWPGTRGIVWKGTLLCIGGAALSACFAGSHLALPEFAGRLLRRATVALFAIYAVTIAFFRSDFRVAIIGYLPSVLFLMAAIAAAWLRSKDGRMLWGLAGLAITLAAAPLQQAGIGLHPRYFNHNALYHVVQGLGFLLLFPAARAAAQPRRDAHAIAT